MQGILAKIAYQHGSTPQNFFLLRLLFVLPLVWYYRKIIYNNFCFKAFFAGVFGYYAAALAGVISLFHIQANVNAFLSLSYPIFVIVLNIFFFKIFPSKIQLLALIFIQIGLYLIVGRNLALLTDNNIMGIGLALLSSFFFAAYICLNHSSSKIIPPLHFTVLAIFGAFAFTMFTAPFLIDPSSINTANLGITFISGVLQILAIYLIALAIKFIGSTNLSLIGTLNPLFALIFAFFFIGETLSILQIVGGGIIAVSVALLEYRQSKTDASNLNQVLNKA